MRRICNQTRKSWKTSYKRDGRGRPFQGKRTTQRKQSGKCRIIKRSMKAQIGVKGETVKRLRKGHTDS